MKNGRQAFILGVFCAILMITCGVGYGQNALKRLWIDFGLYPCTVHDEVHSCPHVQMGLADYGRAYITGDLLGGCACGVIMDFSGPRLAFMIGEIFVIVSVAITFTKRAVGPALLLFGATTSMILNSSISLSQQFPEHSTFVMSLLSSSVDVAQIIYPGSIYFGMNYRQVSMVIMCFAAAAIFLGAVYIPTSMEEAENEETCEMMFPVKPPSLASQVIDPSYWLYGLLWCLLIIRMTVYLDLNISALEEMGDVDGDSATLLSWFLPISSVIGIVFGVIVDRIGVLPATMIINIAGLAVDAITASSIHVVQPIAFVCFIIYRSSIYTLLFAYVKESFHASHFGMLTGIPGLVAGLLSILCGPLEAMAYRVTGSHRTTFIVLAVIGVLSQLILTWLNTHVTKKMALHRRGSSLRSSSLSIRSHYRMSDYA